MPHLPTASRATLGAFVLLLCGLSACTRGAAEHANILLISVDTLRTDHMSAYGYALPTTPQISRFFAEGAIFENAYATSSYTTASMVSVLSGLLPQDHGVRLFDQLLPEGVELVTDLLPATYQKAAFVSNGVLSHRGLGVGDRFDHFDDDMERGGGSHLLERNATATTDAAVRWLESGRDPERPLFLWVHYMDPHAPYAPPEAWASTPESTMGANGPEPIVRHRKRYPNVDPIARIRDYDAEIAYTDHEIGRLLARYSESANLDSTLAILTADHGESLSERASWFQHAYHVFEELVRVPLMLRGPGVEAGHRAVLVSGLDLLPTMLAFAGVPATKLPGADLRDAGLATREPVLFVESINNFDGSQWRAAVTPRGKWLVRARAQPAPLIFKRGYVPLDRDPGETRLAPWPKGDGPGTRLLELLERDPAPGGRPSEYRRGDLTQEEAEILRQLGYIR